MLRRFKNWLKKHEPFATIAWLRMQRRDFVDPSELRACGREVKIFPGVTISSPHMVSLGENVVLHPGVMINGGGGLVIGNNVGVSYDTVIWTGDHSFHTGEALPFDRDVYMRPVRINDNVAIGARAAIMPGLEIGEGAIIGMGAVVSSDVKPLAVMFGNPARAIGFRDRDHYERLKAEGRFVDFVHSRGYDQHIVPLFIQNRPRLYDIVKDEVRAGKAVLEEKEEASGPDAE